jgi:ferritin
VKRKQNKRAQLNEKDSDATDFLKQYQAEQEKNFNLLAQIATQNIEFTRVVAECDGLVTELGEQALCQQQLQEGNRVLRERTEALQGNFDDLRTRVN